jgi:prenyltransferase beta subunit
MRRLLLVFVAVALLAAPSAALAQGADVAAANRAAIAWMRAQQQPDGSFLGFSAGDTADAVVALVAAGEDPDAFSRDGNSPLDYLKAQAAGFAATGPGSAAKLTLAAVAAGEDPAAFGGVNLLEQLGKGYDAATGQYGPDVYGHALALLAIKAVGAPVPAAAVSRTLALQLEDGGWSFDGTAGTGSDTNTTSLVIQALAGVAGADAARGRALDYLRGQQNEDGGFPYSQSSQFGNATDANSTAAAHQALLAAGEDFTAAPWARSGTTASALLGLQNTSGAFKYQATPADDNALATYAAISALAGKALPVATTTVAGAAELIAPSAPAAPVAPAATVPAALPATGAAELPVAGLALAGLALAAAGAAVRRRAA